MPSAGLALEKGLPCNLDAERFVLGSILMDDSHFVQVAGTIEGDDACAAAGKTAGRQPVAAGDVEHRFALPHLQELLDARPDQDVEPVVALRHPGIPESGVRTPRLADVVILINHVS